MSEPVGGGAFLRSAVAHAMRSRHVGMTLFVVLSTLVWFSLDQMVGVERGSSIYWLIIVPAALLPLLDARSIGQTLIGSAKLLLLFLLVAGFWHLSKADVRVVLQLGLFILVLTWVSTDRALLNVNDLAKLYLALVVVGIGVKLLSDINPYGLIPGQTIELFGRWRVSLYPNIANSGLLALAFVFILTKDRVSARAYWPVLAIATYFLIFSFVRAAFVAAILYFVMYWWFASYRKAHAERMFWTTIVVTVGIIAAFIWSPEILYRLQHFPVVSELLLRGQSNLTVAEIAFQLQRPWLLNEQLKLFLASPWLMGWGLFDFQELVASQSGNSDVSLIFTDSVALPTRLLTVFGIPGALFTLYLVVRLRKLALEDDRWACACFPALFVLMLSWGAAFHPTNALFVVFLLIVTRGSKGFSIVKVLPAFLQQPVVSIKIGPTPIPSYVSAIALCAVVLTCAVAGVWSYRQATQQEPVSCGADIIRPGNYYLAADCKPTSLRNIRILANDVVLDLNGKAIECSPPDPSRDVTIGILVQGSVASVFGGAIRGCRAGIDAAGASLTVRNVVFADSYIDISNSGAGSVIENNRFLAGGGFAAEAHRIAINCTGSNTIIRHNGFFDLYRQAAATPETAGEGVAVVVCGGATDVAITDNWIENTTERPNSVAVWMAEDTSGTIARNTIIGFRRGVASAGVATVQNNNFVLRSKLAGSIAIGSRQGSASGNRIIGFEQEFWGPIAGDGNWSYRQARQEVPAPVSCGADIIRPGNYYLAADCKPTSLRNIRILANDVVLDLNGKTIECSPPDPSMDVTFGILVQGSMASVFGGAIRGCRAGIDAAGASLTVRNVVFANSYIDISNSGAGSVIENNRFLAGGGFAAEAYRVAVNCTGSNTIVRHNGFFDLYRQAAAAPGVAGEGVAVVVCSGATDVAITDNWIENTTERPNSVAVWMAEDTSGTIARNTIIGFRQGVASAGVATVQNNNFVLGNTMAHSIAIGSRQGIASGNRITGFEEKLWGSIVDGGNVVR